MISALTLQFYAYEAAQEFAGCVDGGSGDLSTNKNYLNRMYITYSE